MIPLRLSSLLAVLLALGALSSQAAAQTLYLETYTGEIAFPTSPEIDSLGLGGMNAGSLGAGPPPLPVPTGATVAVAATSVGGSAFANEISGTGVIVDPLLALGTPFSATAGFENLSVVGSTSDPNGALGVGFVATLLHDAPATYYISADVFSVDAAGPPPPQLNISESDAGVGLGLASLLLPASFDRSAFDLTLVVDPVAGTAIARVSSGGQTFETAPLVLQAFGGRQNVSVSQIAGIRNAYGSGDLVSSEFREFRIDSRAPLAVGIDIMPGTNRNVIDSGRDLTNVAILSGDGFDARTVVPATILLGAAPVAVDADGRERCRARRVNRDSLPDLLCQVVTSQIGAPLGESIVTLTATTSAGGSIIGHDKVLVVR